MEFEIVYRTIHSLWLVWLMTIFIAIAAWAFWPSRKRRMEEHGRIPLRDDE